MGNKGDQIMNDLDLLIPIMRESGDATIYTDPKRVRQDTPGKVFDDA